jgi:hypothetical protein
MPKAVTDIDLSKHVTVPLSDRLTMYFKTKLGKSEEQDELEFVMIANGTSFVGLGWRPVALGAACKNWPFDIKANQISTRAKRQAVGAPTDPASGEYQSQEQYPQDYQDEPYLFLNEWAAHDPFTPMDCSDIIIGTARGGLSRVRDYYARGRHTPQMDSSWGGKDDLIGATGWEVSGITTIIFRRKARTNDGPDHTIKDEMQLIWSRGQQPGEYVANPYHQLEKGQTQTSPFYVEDELKYHGLGTQRGVLFINFTAARNEFIK